MDNYEFDNIFDNENDYEEFEDDYATNAPCDFSGYCSGFNCPYFIKCEGAWKG